MPTEAELARILGVAIGTLRKSLALMAEKGILERIQGSGTYVKRASAGKPIYELFRLELTHGPGLPTAHILDVRLMARPLRVPILGVGPCKKVWRVRRIRFLSQTPVALEEIWFDGALCSELKPVQLGDSMYLFYQQNFGIWISRVEDRVSVSAVPNWASMPFKPEPGDQAGFIERTSWTSTNVAIEFSQTWFDPKVCLYSSRLSQ